MFQIINKLYVFLCKEVQSNSGGILLNIKALIDYPQQILAIIVKSVLFSFFFSYFSQIRI